MTILGEKTVRARKDHNCTGCLGKIKSGERYYKFTYVDDVPMTTKLCSKCYYVWSTNDWHPDDRWSEGDLKEEHEFVPDGYVIPA